MTGQQISWNLNELFSSQDDPKISQAIIKATQLASQFEKTYRGKIVNLNTEGLLECLKSIEFFKIKFSDLSLYSSLCFAANMTLPPNQSLYDRISKLKATLNKQLAFFGIELGKLLESNPKIITDPKLQNYKHMLERVYRDVKHQLSEIEEQIIIEKDQFGVNAWQDLQRKWLNTRMFKVTVMREKKNLSYGEANGLLTHVDRATRESANKSIYGTLGQDGELFASALRSICNDWVTVSKRRKYDSPMHASLISNDTQQPIIDNLLRTIEKNAKIYRSYLELKAKIMNLPQLGNHDLVAPLPDAPEQKFSFQQAQELVTQAYSRLDSEYATAVKEMFSKQHIDASPRFGKRNGAFCACYYNGKSAYILSSFTGTLSDVFTLAHELGHATHDWYASRNQTISNMSIPSIVAETASIFGELLLTDQLLDQAKTKAEKTAVLCLVLDEAGMTAFQVSARVWFEQTLYSSIEKGEYLDYQTICNLWTDARSRIYKNAVTWLPEMDAEWTMKPHYFMPNYRFYNYPYVYAQMFVYALYDQYLKEGKTFAPKLKEALSAGSSVSPLQIGKIVNLDGSEPNFWNKGINVFERFFNQLQEII
ncbi:MAG: M3 family metallopeptidase [Candidatus Bathyarchaeota archaeon]|nr:M3 family metallopeptidase [Candidatus Bathyarchaeum tardum]